MLNVSIRLGTYLGKMSLVVRCNSAHVRNVILVVLGRILLRILLQYFDDLPTTFEISLMDRPGD